MPKTLIKSLTASGDGELEFKDGTDDVVMDNTYDVYEFHYVNMHPATNQVDFMFQVNASGGADFDEAITSTAFRAYQNEADSPHLGYNAGYDQANADEVYQPLTYETGYDNDQACSGILTLYAPSSTTYVKHFMARTNDYQADDHSIDNYIAGYINTTSAIDEISFKFDSGNIDAGTIKMFGVS
tara:strand:- start:130 stop:681 length:552 start_codon:yes stop_codon:yes gene_type:complete